MNMGDLIFPPLLYRADQITFIYPLAIERWGEPYHGIAVLRHFKTDDGDKTCTSLA